MNSIKKEILKLKEEKNAVILAHYYVNKEIKEIADYVGDSLKMAEIASGIVEKDTIVVCGVYFMGESVKILSPDKEVLIPVIDAGCPMADMVSKKELIKLKEKHKDAKVVCYVNSSAEVKSISDICCTSSNAVKIVKNIDSQKVIFIPDKNLGSYVAKQVPQKEVILWEGYCPVHNNVTLENTFDEHIEILVHPECTEEIRQRANYIGSTSGIIEYVNKSMKSKFIIATEQGILSDLVQQNPQKEFVMISENFICEDMKKISLESVRCTLNNRKNIVEIDEDIRSKAFIAINNMLNS